MSPSTERVKLVVFVPTSHAAQVRQALGEAGAGQIGAYTHCSFSSRGVGRFRPGPGARPFVGQQGQDEAVEEERVEVVVRRELLETVLVAMRRAHPYEEVAYDVYPLLDA